MPCYEYGNFILFCDATFSFKEGKSKYGLAIYFDHSLVFAGAVIRCRCSSTKEAKTRAIFYAVRKAIEQKIFKPHFLSDVMEVFKAQKWVEDWANKNLVDDILDSVFLF